MSGDPVADDADLAQEVRDSVEVILAATEVEWRMEGKRWRGLRSDHERGLFEAGVEAGRLATIWTLRRRGWLRARRRRA